MLSKATRVIGVIGAIGVVGLGGVPAHAQSAAPPESRRTSTEAERQADLVAGEDQRVMEALVAGLPTLKHPKVRSAYRTTSPGLNLVLTGRRAPYTFDDLRKLAPDTLVPQAKGTFLLQENIIVAAGATLSITPNQPLRIRMKSGPDGFVSLVTQGG